MKVNTHLNILISYAYTNAALLKRLQELVGARKINVMFDSGAFTKFNASGEFGHVNLRDYCRFLHKYADISEKYVMLDVIGNAAASKRNYLWMLDEGLNPMFVVTMFDKDYDFMREAVSRNPNICVAGGATTKNLWMQKRYQDIFQQSSERAKIHGLAFATYPKMLQLPLASVDSSSWKAAALRFGGLQYFDRGLKSIPYREFLRGEKKMSFPHQLVLSNLKITPAMFCNREYHKGNYSIEAFASVQANIAMQKVCKRKGLDYFMAITSQMDIEKIVYVNDNYNDLSFEKFRKEFGK